MDELTIGGKTYVSSKRAAEITGYAKDYVGQLCREGQVEARMVGRSWYVLESSIREHRFGKEKEEKEVEKPENKPSFSSSRWEKPVYEPESAPVIPELTERISVNVFEMEREVFPTPSEHTSESAALSDMQSAWREWFSQRQEENHVEPENEAEEASRPVYEQKDEEVTPVVLQKIEEETFDEAYEEPVAIHRSYSSMPLDIEPSYVEKEEVVEERLVETTGNRGAQMAVSVPARGGSSLPLKAGLLAIAGLAVVIAALGSGYADGYRALDINSPILDYLQGEKVYKKQSI